MARLHDIVTKINADTKLGDLRNLAKDIKTDQQLADQLWAHGALMARLLAILVMDKKSLDNHAIDLLLQDIYQHPAGERTQLADWLLANQLTKDKKTIAIMHSWENDRLALKRRLFWYYQGRLRWTGQKPPYNTPQLLAAINERMPHEDAEVQWAMNFTAGWIGVFDPRYRQQCIEMGERLGLYKDKMVARNCSPDYLPDFITSEVQKRNMV